MGPGHSLVSFTRPAGGASQSFGSESSRGEPGLCSVWRARRPRTKQCDRCQLWARVAADAQTDNYFRRDNSACQKTGRAQLQLMAYLHAAGARSYRKRRNHGVPRDVSPGAPALGAAGPRSRDGNARGASSRLSTPRRSAPVFADASGPASRRANPRAFLLDLPPIKPAATNTAVLVRAKFIAAYATAACSDARLHHPSLLQRTPTTDDPCAQNPACSGCC